MSYITTPQDQIKARTHLFCPNCFAAVINARDEWRPETIKLPIWPQPIAWFSEGHVNSIEEFICNFHGNKEFNPHHDCLRNSCDT